MKATLEFNLPEETEQHRMSLDGPALYSALLEFNEYIIRQKKYCENAELRMWLDSIHVKLHDIINDHGLCL